MHALYSSRLVPYDSWPHGRDVRLQNKDQCDRYVPLDRRTIYAVKDSTPTTLLYTTAYTHNTRIEVCRSTLPLLYACVLCLCVPGSSFISTHRHQAHPLLSVPMRHGEICVLGDILEGAVPDLLPPHTNLLAACTLHMVARRFRFGHSISKVLGTDVPLCLVLVGQSYDLVVIDGSSL